MKHKKYERVSCIVIFCCALPSVILSISFILPTSFIFTNIIQDYFTCTGAIKLYVFPAASQASLQSIGKLLDESIGNYHITTSKQSITLQCRHNEGNSVLNHRRLDCLLGGLFRRRSRKKIKAQRHWPLWGEFTGDRWIHTQRASNVEHISIWWRNHAQRCLFATQGFDIQSYSSLRC